MSARVQLLDSADNELDACVASSRFCAVWSPEEEEEEEEEEEKEERRVESIRFI